MTAVVGGILAFFAGVPFAVWATLAGIAGAGGIWLWWTRSKKTAAQKLSDLRIVEGALVQVARILHLVAPWTPTAADDKAAAYVDELLAQVRAAIAAVKAGKTPNPNALVTLGSAGSLMEHAATRAEQLADWAGVRR